jgi:hypothetical protein
MLLLYPPHPPAHCGALLPGAQPALPSAWWPPHPAAAAGFSAPWPRTAARVWRHCDRSVSLS